MNFEVWKIVKVARRLASTNPLASYDMERLAVAVINPNSKVFEQNIDNAVAVLKSLEQELEDALGKLDMDDAKEFAKFFDDITEAETEELRRVLRKVSTTAGFKDFFKGIFKKKPKDEVSDSSYKLDESTMDDFVEGKRDWADPSHYVEQETAENKEFFGGLDKVLKDVDSIRKNPSKSGINSLLKEIKKLIKHGENLAKGITKHLLEPVPSKVDITEEGMKSKEPSKPSKLDSDKLESTVSYYADLLKDTLGDESKTISLLKELYHAVEPSIKEDRAALASKKPVKFATVLTRIAHAVPELRPRLLPVVKKIVKSP